MGLSYIYMDCAVNSFLSKRNLTKKHNCFIAQPDQTKVYSPMHCIRLEQKVHAVREEEEDGGLRSIGGELLKI